MPRSVHSLHKERKRESADSAGDEMRRLSDDEPMPKKHPVRRHLLAWRLHFGLTQEELANKIGTAHTTVGRWEAGKTGVDDATFSEIARVYGITPAELSAAPSDRGKALHMSRILDALRALDEKALDAVATVAEQMKRRD